MKTYLKNHLFATFIAALVLLSSCLSEDDLTVDNTFSFLNQDLQGLIDGQVFSAGEGTATIFEGELSISIYDTNEDITSACEFIGFGDNVSVFFFVPNAVGVYELGIDFNNIEDGQTVTLFDPSETLNIIATSGAIEILTITDTEITGRLDARVDNENVVNGNFTITNCSN